MELLPVLACVSRGSVSIHAVGCRSCLNSNLQLDDNTRNCSSTSGFGVVRLARACPILTEVLKIAPTGKIPPNLCAAMAAKPMDAMHPHELQSGLPPN